MHGSHEAEDSIVLTRGDFVRYDARYRPAAAVVQSLVLTRHVLFVGVSLQDDNVLRLVYEVSLMRDRTSLQQHWGTVLHLGLAPEKEALSGHELDWITVPDSADDDGPRTVEMLLDAGAAYASDDVPWLLDPRFDGLLDESGAATVARVREVAEAVRLTSHGDPATWAPVLRALESIGLAER